MQRRAVLLGAAGAPACAVPALAAEPLQLKLCDTFMLPRNDRGRYYAGATWRGSNGKLYSAMHASDFEISPEEAAAKMQASKRYMINCFLEQSA